jgi:hypothetical protein
MTHDVPLIEFDEEDLAEFVRQRRAEHANRTDEEAVEVSLAWHRESPGRFPGRFLAAIQKGYCSAVGRRRPR